jgi:hypothetical protein
MLSEDPVAKVIYQEAERQKPSMKAAVPSFLKHTL